MDRPQQLICGIDGSLYLLCMKERDQIWTIYSAESISCFSDRVFGTHLDSAFHLHVTPLRVKLQNLWVDWVEFNVTLAC